MVAVRRPVINIGWLAFILNINSFLISEILNVELSGRKAFAAHKNKQRLRFANNKKKTIAAGGGLFMGFAGAGG